VRLLAVLLIAGCFSKPPRPEGDDAKTSDGNAACSSPPIKDDFEVVAATPCGAGFGGGNAGASIERDSGVLEMTVVAGVANDASCSWNMSFAEGAFAQVVDHTGPGGTFTILQVSIGDLRVGISVIDEATAILNMFDTVLAQDIVQVPYDNNEMAWWRLRPEGGLVLGEYSADGKVWNRLGASTSPAPVDTQVSLNAGAYLALPGEGRARFDNFNVCAP
jgi:hypothetical protein